MVHPFLPIFCHYDERNRKNQEENRRRRNDKCQSSKFKSNKGNVKAKSLKNSGHFPSACLLQGEILKFGIPLTFGL